MFGLTPIEAVLLVLVPLGVRNFVVGDATAGDVIGLAASVMIVPALVVVVRERRRGGSAGRQDWPLTVLVLSWAAVMLGPDEAPNSAGWPVAIAVAFALSGIVVGVRELRRYRDGKRTVQARRS